ncbi:hypothetical protein QBC37DRAFT_379034 [Rhypophila decipiens]|uniref:Uncharacterized protein n=1 Tax=Rhypophila decipiens TaxID=261697 RepID=A0AAN6XZE8_9PEZI|nr:hypothetical protein QBC37DRAFT_379034 [Rhypophila decipiens]
MSGMAFDFGFISGREYRTMLAARQGLEARVADQHTLIMTLKPELNDAKNQLAEAQQKIQALRETNDQLRQQFKQDFQKMHNDVRNQLKALRDQCDKLRKEGELSEKRHQESKLALESCQETMVPQAELDELKVIYNKDLECLHKHYAGEIAKKTDGLHESYRQAIGEARDQPKKELEQQHHTIEERDKTIEHLTKTINAGEAQEAILVNSLRTAYLSMEEQAKNQEDRELILAGYHNIELSACNETIEEQRIEIEDLTKKVKTSEDRELIPEGNYNIELSDCKKTIEEQRSEIEDLTKKVKTSEDRELILEGNHNIKLSARDTTIAQLHTMVAKKDDEIKRVTRNYKKFIDLEKERFNKLITAYKGDIWELEQKVNTCEDRELILKGNFDAQLSHRNKTIQQQGSEIENLTKQLEQANTRSAQREKTLVQKLTAVKAEVDEARLRELSLQETIADFKEAEEAQTAELTKHNEELGVREKMLEEQNDEIRELKEEQSGLEEDVEHLEERLKNLLTLNNSLERDAEEQKEIVRQQQVNYAALLKTSSLYQRVGGQLTSRVDELEAEVREVEGFDHVDFSDAAESDDNSVASFDDADNTTITEPEEDLIEFDTAVPEEDLIELETIVPEENLFELHPAVLYDDLIAELETADPTEENGGDDVPTLVDAQNQEQQASDDDAAVDDCGWCWERERCVPETCKECGEEFSIGGRCDEECGCDPDEIDPDYCHYCSERYWTRRYFETEILRQDDEDLEEDEDYEDAECDEGEECDEDCEDVVDDEEVEDAAAAAVGEIPKEAVDSIPEIGIAVTTE